MDKVVFAVPQREERQANEGTLQKVTVSFPIVRMAARASSSVCVSLMEGGSRADPEYRAASNRKPRL